MDMTLYALLNKKIKGVASGLSSYTVDGTSLTLVFKDGTQATIDFPTPADGVSIDNVKIDENNHLLCYFSDGQTVDAGKIPTIKGEEGFSPEITEDENNNENVYKLKIITKDGTLITPNLKGGSSGGDFSNYYTKEETEKLIQDNFIPLTSSDIDNLLNDIL